MDLGCIKVLEWEGDLGDKFRQGSELAALLYAWCMTLVSDTGTWHSYIFGCWSSNSNGALKCLVVTEIANYIWLKDRLKHVISYWRERERGNYCIWANLSSIQYKNLTPYKVCGYLLPFLNHILLFEWYVVWWGLKSKRLKDTCLKEIGLCLQILFITLRYGVGIGGAQQHMKTSKPNILHIKQLKDDLRLAKEAHNTHHYIAWLRCIAQTTFSPSKCTDHNGNNDAQQTR